MALRKRPGRNDQPEEVPNTSQQLDRVAKLLALLLVKGESQPEKIRVLNASGFGNNEIAQLLGTTANAVTVALYKQRAKK